MPPIVMPIPIAMRIVMVVPVVVRPLHVRIGPIWAAARGPVRLLGSTNKAPLPGKFRVQVNAWLVEDFDPTPPNRSRWLTARGSGERESDEPSHLVGHISG